MSLIERNIIIQMSEEGHKQVKLVQVYKQLNTIKNQLRAMITPLHRPNDNSTLLNINITQAINHQLQPHLSPQTLENTSIPHQTSIPTRCPKPQVQDQQKVAHFKGMNSPSSKYMKQKIPLKIDKKQGQAQNESISAGQTTRRAAQRMRKQLKCMPKIQFSPPKKDKILVKQPKNQHHQHPSIPIKKYSHARHATLCEPSKIQEHFSPNNIQLVKDTNFISPKKEAQKNTMAFNNKNRDVQSKKLTRMKSDFTAFKKTHDHIPKPKIHSISDKVRQLQQEVKKKDEAIQLLFVQLSQIEISFKSMEGLLSNILAHHTGYNQNIRQTDVCQALAEVLRDMQLQKEEVKRLNIQCQQWRKLNLQQQDKLQMLQNKLSNTKKYQQQISFLKQQRDKMENQSAKLASKLQVSVNQNRVKDEFIVKFLSGRNSAETQNCNWISQVLSQYLKTCDYPKNCLLLKLRQEQQQISRLNALLTQNT